MGDFDGELTADKCVSAGLYWFSRSDLEAAEAWWRRALQLEPDHPRARDCLILLERAQAVADRRASWAGIEDRAPDDPFVNPNLPGAASTSGPSPGSPAPAAPPASGRSPAEYPASAPGVPLTTDPLDFASESQSLPYVPPTGVVPDPWDDSSAATSVVEVSADEPFDALAEPTPLPAFAREEYFQREPQSPREIQDYLEAAEVEPDPVPRSLETNDDSLEFDEPVEMASAESASPPAADPLKVARDRFALHDFKGVLECLQLLPAGSPYGNEARDLVAKAQAQLMKMYESKIGDFSRVPRVNVKSEELIWLNLNHRAGFILSQIDGAVTFEDLVALSGMPRIDTLEILTDLLQQRIIT